MVTSSLGRAKSSIIKRLTMPEKKPSSNSPDVFSDIRRVTILSSAVPGCGQVLMTGSDFLDTLYDAYQVQRREECRRALVAAVYVGLVSFMKGPKPNISLLLDQLFSLKAAAKVGAPSTRREPTLLSDLVCSSDLLGRLEKYLVVAPQKRGQDLVAVLRSYQRESKPLHRRYQKHKKRVIDKGKNRAVNVSAVDELHAHKLSLVTQIQDLFPDLGSAYVLKLLDFYENNPETVIAHVLDDALPPHLKTLDKSEQLPTTHQIPHRNPLSPNPTPPEIPSPKPEPSLPPTTTTTNISHKGKDKDKDIDLAELARTPDPRIQGKLRFGRANPTLTADDLLSDRINHATNKAAIMSALAAFDSDDDERDDTYDVGDVGGTVDAVAPGTDADADVDVQARRAEETDMTLFRLYKSSPAVFGRDAATRRSQPRAALKRESGLTDEAIEGWAVMLGRDPKRLGRLEHKLALAGDGGRPGHGGAGAGPLQQPELRPTAYRKPKANQDEESDDALDNDNDAGAGSSQFSSRGGRGRGRGNRGHGAGGRGGRGGRGRGGAGGGGGGQQQNPALSRQRKEENKSSRANHNRRQQRGKKLAGVGLPG